MAAMMLEIWAVLDAPRFFIIPVVPTLSSVRETHGPQAYFAPAEA